MSDKEQDVAKRVVSTALPCRFSPVLLDVHDSTDKENQSRIPFDSSVSTVNSPQNRTNSPAVSAVLVSHSTVAESFALNADNSRPKHYPVDASTYVKHDDSETRKLLDLELKEEKCEEISEEIQSTNNKVTDVSTVKCTPDNPFSKDPTSLKAENSEFRDVICPAFNVQTPICSPTSTSDVGTSVSSQSLNKQKDNEIFQCHESLNDDHRKDLDETEGDNFQNLETECYFSGSTDATLQNSDESTEPEDSIVNIKQDLINVTVKRNKTMGNKQAKTSQVHSDDDTPDDGRTKCCEIPKKKLKEKTSSRGNRTSRNDDLTFESNEVYPFDGRVRSIQDTNEPVELEPFEIVETDDIKFVPGAGTSDVIKSVSEPKFTPIAEEPPMLEDIENSTTSYDVQETNVKVPFFIDKGNRLLEPGTATAHSTFEFRQVKPKMKLSKTPGEQTQPNYENVSLEEACNEARNEPNASCRKTSSSSSKSSSSSSSKSVSRKNSKDAIPKPARKGKIKSSNVAEESNVVGGEGENKTKTEQIQKQQSIRDSEIDRNIDSVLMLTQTMFSQTKVAESQDTKKNKDQPQAVALTQYENVNVCAKLEPTGITITHKNTPLDLPKHVSEAEATSEAECIGNYCEGQDDNVQVKKSRRKNYPQLSTDIVEISESGTLIIKSLADLPSAKRLDEVDDERSENTSEDELNDTTDVKVPYETIDRLSAEIKKEALAIETPSKTEANEFSNEKEHVPPPSPLIMGALEEEEEEEEDMGDGEDGVDFREEDRRKSEILEFTESVCKRLSLLLDSAPEERADAHGNEHSEEKKLTNYEDHIYETIDGSTRIIDQSTNSDSRLLITDEIVEGIELTSETAGDRLKLSTRSESSSTLKRTSGDSETYKSTDTRKSPQSDDELPDYFDPRDIPPPRRDSEILCDVLDSYSDDALQVEELPANEVAEIVKTQTLAFEGLNYDNLVLENKDKGISLPVKSFEIGLINDTPSHSITEDLRDITPTAEAQPNLTALPELAKAEEETPVQFETSGRQSVTCTESDIDISEHRDDLSTDSMLADDEAEETMEILFTKTYTEPVEGAEVFLSCTVVNSAYKDEQKKSETWLSDEALEYLEANASEVMSTAFLKAKKEMKDIQICLQSLRQQMEHFHSDCDDISLPEIPVDSLSPDYFGIPMRKAVTD